LEAPPASIAQAGSGQEGVPVSLRVLNYTVSGYSAHSHANSCVQETDSDAPLETTSAPAAQAESARSEGAPVLVSSLYYTLS
jgi:hypothetical protein